MDSRIMPPHGGYVHVYMRGCEATAPRYQYLSRAPETLSAHLSMRKETALDIIIHIRRASSTRGARKRARSKS